MRKQLLIEGVFDGDRKGDSVNVLQGWVHVRASEDQTVRLEAATAGSSFHAKQLLDKAVHVEKGMQLLL